LALLYDEGRLGDGQVLRHESIVGTTFVGRVVSSGTDGVITEVEGAAYQTGTATFTLDPRDPLGTGFTLR
jgi:proline racemase